MSVCTKTQTKQVGKQFKRLSDTTILSVAVQIEWTGHEGKSKLTCIQ